MIPKTIHYCWFGGKPKPNNVLGYINTWKEKMPDYEIKEWNEDNFNVNTLDFTREAYFAKKYAFVSDVARLHALYTEGGVYLDTDIIILKHFPDELLSLKAFAGFEHDFYIGTGIIGSEKHNHIIKDFLSLYENRHFFRHLRFDMTPNVNLFTSLLKNLGLKTNNTLQHLDGISLYPQDVFCCKDCRTGERYDNERSLSVHDFTGLWTDKRNGVFNKIIRQIKETITIIKYNFLRNNEE